MSEQTEKAPFTPPPWVRDGTIVGQHTEIDLRLDDEGDNWITVKGDDGATVEANARLISASPDMYEALKQVAAETGGSYGPASDYVTAQTAEAVRAALARAEGRE